ncbi:MAG: hypothetical protein O8C67_15070 [Candidatus Methanoperedens sp.]|nr:hypothetical protein [Candidatus Methanoperedens sp.]
MRLDMLLSRNIRWCNIRIVAGIAILLLFLLASSASAEPPPAILSIDGNEQTAVIGTNCWKVENETFPLCSDYAGIITPAEPLLTRSPFTAHLRMPLPEPPEELGFSVTRVTDDDELKSEANSVRVWSLKYENATNRYKRPLEREPDIYLSLKPGLYVLRVDANWKDNGSVSYGFLVKVYEPEAEVTTQAATATESEKSTTSSPNETHNITPTEKAAGFQFALAITILLAVYSGRRKRK